MFLLINVGLFVFLLFNMEYWKTYFLTNAFLILSYIWFNYIRLFAEETKKQDFKPLKGDVGYSVIVPCKDEKPELLRACVRSIINQTDSYKKEVIIINDGSKNKDVIIELKKIKNMNPNFDITIIDLEENRGKRFAHYSSFMMAKYDFVISMDSDTSIGDDAIYKLLRPFSDRRIGATTGNILVKNESINLLTRMQAALYWVGLSIHKKSQSRMDSIICCSGCLSAYRKEILLKVRDEYYNQIFLGKPCIAGEDRHLTNLVHLNGYRVVFVEDSISYTEVPDKFSTYIKQQRRWKSSFYRESLYILANFYPQSKRIFFEVLWISVNNILNLSMRLMAVVLLISNITYFIAVILPAWLLYVITVNSLIFLNEPKTAVWYIPYLFVYAFLLYFMNVYTIINPVAKSWGTR